MVDDGVTMTGSQPPPTANLKALVFLMPLYARPVQSLLVCIALLGVINLLMFFSANFQGVDRALISIDYALVVLALIGRDRRILLCALLAALFSDYLYIIASVYNFQGIAFLLETTNLAAVDVWRALPPTTFLICMGFNIALVMWLATLPSRPPTERILLRRRLTITVALLLVLDAANGSLPSSPVNMYLERDEPITSLNLATSPALKAFTEIAVRSGLVGHFSQTQATNERPISALLHTLGQSEFPPRAIDRVVLVIVESWGRFNEPDLNQTLAWATTIGGRRLNRESRVRPPFSNSAV